MRARYFELGEEELGEREGRGGGERGGEGRSVGRSVLLCCTHPRGLLFEGVEVGKKVREVVKSEEVEVGRPRSKRGGL